MLQVHLLLFYTCDYNLVPKCGLSELECGSGTRYCVRTQPSTESSNRAQPEFVGCSVESAEALSLSPCHTVAACLITLITDMDSVDDHEKALFYAHRCTI